MSIFFSISSSLHDLLFFVFIVIIVYVIKMAQDKFDLEMVEKCFTKCLIEDEDVNTFF